MKHRLVGLTAMLLVLPVVCLAEAYNPTKLPIVRIGIARDGPSIRFPANVDLFKREIVDLTSGEFDVRFPLDKTIHGSWTIAGVKRAVDLLLADPEVDLIVALGPNVSNEVLQRRSFPKPVIAPIVIDAELQGVPLKDGTSGVKNLTYINSFTSFDRDVKAFLEVVRFRRLAVLVGSLALESVPSLRQKVRRVGFEYTIDIEIVPVDTSSEEALDALPPGTDAVYVTPLLRFTPTEFEKLVSRLMERNLPSFSMWGRDEVEIGILAGVAPRSDFQRLARRVALDVQSILLGEDAGLLEVAFPRGSELTINMATARAIGVYPPWKVLTEAEPLNEAVEDIERRYTLDSAVREAIAANLDLAAEDRNVAAGEQVVKQARSTLLPQIDLDAAGIAIDEDRARVSLGVQPERSVSGSATLSQLIYSEDAWSNYRVEKHLQVSRKEQRDTVRLDITRDAAVTYLNVLRAKTLEGIQKENLKLTRANLDRARVRVSIGVASRAEEYRWESEIANVRRDVLQAQARRQQAETNFNRLLNRPLEEPFLTEEADLRDPVLLISDKRFFFYVDNPRNFSLFRDFLVEEGLATAPELKQFDAAIAAQERILMSSKRAFWVPTFAFEGSVTELLAEGGAGTREDSLTGLNNTDWSLGLFATFPLVEGGGKFATIKRAREDLSSLRLDRQSTAEKVAERIRVALDETGFSYPNIGLSRDAAEAAKKNLNLVTDSYERGVVSIIDLLDAQNNALVAVEEAENAVYNFLIDLMNVQRAIGKFDFFLSPQEREAWFQRLKTFYIRAGVAPGKR